MSCIPCTPVVCGHIVNSGALLLSAVKGNPKGKNKGNFWSGTPPPVRRLKEKRRGPHPGQLRTAADGHGQETGLRNELYAKHPAASVSRSRGEGVAKRDTQRQTLARVEKSGIVLDPMRLSAAPECALFQRGEAAGSFCCKDPRLCPLSSRPGTEFDPPPGVRVGHQLNMSDFDYSVFIFVLM